MVESTVSAVRRALHGVRGVDSFVAGRVEYHRITGFLDEDECRRLVEIARAHGNPRDLAASSDPLVLEVDARVCSLVGLDAGGGEPLQYRSCATAQAGDPDRWTIAVYLRDAEQDDAPSLGRSGCRLRLRRGTALICNGPAPAGGDAVLTKALHIREPTLPPARTPPGFHRCLIPGALFDALREFHAREAANAAVEHVPGYIESERAVASHLLLLPPARQQEVHAALHLIMEHWAGTALLPTYVYGIRRYARGARLKVHRDRPGTHVFGATLNVAQQLEEPWPLVIDDHLGRRHEVALQPGEMLLYEGERLLHGRPRPLRGEFYAGVFAHYRPCRGTEIYARARQN